ncbi:uncharacterized protein TM35_000201220 [Trypanosoma theileri]|uniref:Ubiquitin-like domain-containing protein n=1 Tax=Trypanosoma theileri TaxID=67003 RepID=A0A1X0NTB4_9TRYP|nr:uncharacterized protein TM35_000201220 [Trypanosoma theileri]ORC87713.1 hypothetical protein TM35_000201220 [Trypanosoma theileri]
MEHQTTAIGNTAAAGQENFNGNSGRTHHPYGRCYNSNGRSNSNDHDNNMNNNNNNNINNYYGNCNSNTTNNNTNNTNTNNNNNTYNNHENGNQRFASSPMLVAPRPSHNGEEEGIVTSPVNVQARYRLHSPTLSCRTGDGFLSTSPCDNTLRSPPPVWSAGSSYHGDLAQNRFMPTVASSAPSGVSFDNSLTNRAVMPYPVSYAPSNFTMPPVLTGNMPPARRENPERSPLGDNYLEAPHPYTRIGSPPAANGLSVGNNGYTSPILLPSTPPYSGDFNPMRSPNGNAQRRGSGKGTLPTSTPSTLERSHPRQSKFTAVGTLAEESSIVSGSSASSIRDDLELCPDDGLCTLINDRKHQRKYAHTCRLFPCYHGHVVRHAKLFRHAPGQIAQAEGLSSDKGKRKKFPAEALASVNFSSISPEASNAYRVIVSHGDKSYEIFGDWQSVRVHTFKRYLHQVFKIPPASQVLVRVEGAVQLDNELQCVSQYDVRPDTVITLRRKEDDDERPRVPIEDL